MTEQKKPQPKPQPTQAAIPSNLKLVISAYLHAPVMLPGGQTEGSLTQIKLPGIKLWWLRGEGLIVQHKNQKALIPAANVAICYVDEPSE